MCERVQHLYTVNPMLFLQILLMGLQAILLIFLTGTCATAGNGVRLKKSKSFV